MSPIAHRRTLLGVHSWLVAKVPAPLPIGSMYHAPVVATDEDFDARWAAWVEHGSAHERRVRDWFVIWVGTLMVGAAIMLASLRS